LIGCFSELALLRTS